MKSSSIFVSSAWTLAISQFGLVSCGEPEPFAQQTELTFQPQPSAPETVEPEVPSPVPNLDAGSFSEPEPTPVPEPSPAEPEPAIPSLPNPEPAAPEDAGPGEPPIAPPMVTAFNGERGVWGDTLIIAGSSLGNGQRSGVSLSLGHEGDEGEALVMTPEDDAVLMWTETRIEFRVPFPHQGAIVVTTPQGEAPAGRFESEWQLGPAVGVGSGAQVLSSVSSGVDSITFAIDTVPVTLLHFDGSVWTELSLPSDDVAPETFRLYLNADGEVDAFALTATDATLVAFTQASGYAPTLTPFTVEAEFALAGGPDGAVLWHHPASGWERLRPSASGWAQDAGPFDDPAPSGDLHTPGATSDGALYIAIETDTGNFLDDTAAPFLYRLAPDASTFDGPFRGGNSVDDYLTSLTLKDRGRGLLVEYCGSDVDPFNVTGTAYRCFSAAHSSQGQAELSGLKESGGALHAFTHQRVGVAYCDDDEGTRLTAARSNNEGAVVAWPCITIEALEIDSDARWVPILRYEEAFYPLIAAERAGIDFTPEASLPTDAGHGSGSPDSGDGTATVDGAAE